MSDIREVLARALCRQPLKISFQVWAEPIIEDLAAEGFVIGRPLTAERLAVALWGINFDPPDVERLAAAILAALGPTVEP